MRTPPDIGEKQIVSRDPFTAFLEVHERLRNAKPFEGGEHMWLGNSGALRAILSAPDVPFGRFKRRHTPNPLSYGEIVAFSGDFYETPDALFDEAPALLPWLWEDNDLEDLANSFAREVAWAKLPPGARGTEYPDQTLALWWNAKQYVELALQNDAHFGWHNALAYVQYHAAALELARQAHRAHAPDERDLLWRQAIYTNGFADHFLTDSFAAGHVRTPSAQIRAWAAGRGWSPKRAGALVKVIHDHDGHVARLHGSDGHDSLSEGLRVRNTKGDSWITRCDGQLFLSVAADEASRIVRPGSLPPEVEMPVEAVAASLGELLAAYREGSEISEGPFAATRFMPFPDADEVPLVGKFPGDVDDERLNAIYENVNLIVRAPILGSGITREDIRECFRQLPTLMEEFRASVAADAVRLPFVQRLEANFVESYRSLR